MHNTHYTCYTGAEKNAYELKKILNIKREIKDGSFIQIRWCYFGGKNYFSYFTFKVSKSGYIHLRRKLTKLARIKWNSTIILLLNFEYH